MLKIHQILIAIDQLANSLFGGYADETLSARSYRLHTESRGWLYLKILIDLIFFWQPEHCYHAWLSEFERKQYPTIYSELTSVKAKEYGK